VWPREHAAKVEGSAGLGPPGPALGTQYKATEEQTQPNPLLKPTCYLEVPHPSSSSGSNKQKVEGAAAKAAFLFDLDTFCREIDRPEANELFED
jgi:hypothetical protein